MPYVNIKITLVVVDEVDMEDWGVGGLPVDEFRRLTAVPRN